jgi:hypothetical protein
MVPEYGICCYTTRGQLLHYCLMSVKVHLQIFYSNLISTKNSNVIPVSIYVIIVFSEFNVSWMKNTNTYFIFMIIY